MSLPAIEYLVEIVAYDPSGPGTVTLRYSTIGKTTGPAETPANTFYDARLQEPGVIRRAIAEGRELFGAARISVGEVVLQNLDGALDALATYGFDGRTRTLRQGVPGAAYPSGYTTVDVGTMDDVEVTRKQVRIRLRDNTFGLDTPLQTTTYDGDNALPAGLEGVAGDLKGKVKPLLYGVAKNLPVPCVNTAKLIYQVSDGAIGSVEAIKDKGIILHGDQWATPVAVSAFSGAEIRAGMYVEDWGLHVLAGTGPVLVTSPDFSTWSTETVGGTPTRHEALAYSEGLGIGLVCGLDGKIATSTDGETWTGQTSGTANDLWRAAASDDILVVAGGAPTAAEIWTSTNGSAWTSRTPSITNSIRGLFWGGGQFIAVSRTGEIATSPNGITWTARTTPLTGTNSKAGIGYGVFEPLGGAYMIGHATQIATSTDGVSWTRRTDVASGLIERFAFNGAAMLAGSRFANTTSITRDAGQTWELTSLSAAPYDIYWDGDYFRVCIGDGTVTSNSGYRTFASLADLEDDDEAPPPGSAKYISHANGSYVRLGSPPAGLITVDATQGATAANRTAGQLFVAVLTKAGYTAGAWSASDITALDTADNSECGLWIDSALTTFEALDMIAASVGAWWGTDKAGVFRVKQWTTPSGTPVMAFTDNDLLTLERLPSDRPVYRTTLQYARNYVVQDRDVAFGVTEARRASLAKEWREAVNESASVQTMHLLADATVEPTLYATEADALAEATRRQTLRGTKRTRLIATVALDADTEALDLGDVVTVTSTRFGLSAGVDFRITALEPQRATRRLRLSLWA